MPQLGDDVVYIPEGHQLLLEELGSNAARPWEEIFADEVRAPRPSLQIAVENGGSSAAVRGKHTQGLGYMPCERFSGSPTLTSPQ